MQEKISALSLHLYKYSSQKANTYGPIDITRLQFHPGRALSISVPYKGFSP